MVKKMDMLYEGKAKKVFLTDDPIFFGLSIKMTPQLLMGKKRGPSWGKGN